MTRKANVTIEVKMSPPISAVLKALGAKMDKLTDFRPLNMRVSTFFFQWVQRNFRTEGRELADPKWPPFKYGGRVVSKTRRNSKGNRVRNKLAKAQSVVNRSHIDPSAKLLQDTGLLRQSFNPPYYDSKLARVGSFGERSPVAERHHFGIGHLPERQLVPRPEQVQKEIYDIALEYTKRVLK